MTSYETHDFPGTPIHLRKLGDIGARLCIRCKIDESRAHIEPCKEAPDNLDTLMDLVKECELMKLRDSIKIAVGVVK